MDWVVLAVNSNDILVVYDLKVADQVVVDRQLGDAHSVNFGLQISASLNLGDPGWEALSPAECLDQSTSFLKRF